MSPIKKYGDIVNKQFKVNKRRNLSTILGIILSVILFTTVGFIQEYYRDINILYAKNNNGNYDVVFKGISKGEVELLKNNVLVETIGVYSEVFSSRIKVSEDREKIIKLSAVDKIILNELFSPIVKLQKGRFPEKYGEVIIDDLGTGVLNKNIGDTIELGGKEYNVVGIYTNDTLLNTYEINMITYFDEKSNYENINTAFTVKTEKDKTSIIRDIANNLGIKEINESKETGSKGFIFNKVLFYHYGEKSIGEGYLENDSKRTEVILYGIILVLTTFLTYGSINVSIKERVEQFSILRCIGARKSKIRKLLIKESLFLAIFSLVPGIIIGQIFSYGISNILFKQIVESTVYTIQYKIYFNVILITVVLTIINIFLATIIPIINIGTISPIEGITNGRAIKKNIKGRKSKIIKGLFGYNGELAYKNIRANNRNFIITTLTSIIILSTFIVFTGYKNNILNSFERENNITKDFSIDISVKYAKKYDDVYEELDKYKGEIEDLQISEKIYGRISSLVSGIFKNISLNKYIKDRDNQYYIKEKSINQDGEQSVYSNGINFIIMDDEALKELITVQNLDITLEDFKENGVLIADRAVVKNLVNVAREPIFSLEKGDKLNLELKSGKDDWSQKDVQKEIEDIRQNNREISFKYLDSINGEKIFDSKRYGSDNYINLVASKDFYYENLDLFTGDNNNENNIIDPNSIIFVLELKHNIDRNVATEILQSYSRKIEATYLDNKLSNVRTKNQLIISSSYMYVVLLLIIITGGINLINNKNINIKLRGKEIGTLLALGINKKRLKKILMLEGIVQWLIASAVSIILSYVSLSILYKVLMYSTEIITNRMPIGATILGCSVLFIINILGVYLPIRKLKYTDTMELIRNKE